MWRGVTDELFYFWRTGQQRVLLAFACRLDGLALFFKPTAGFKSHFAFGVGFLDFGNGALDGGIG